MRQSVRKDGMLMQQFRIKTTSRVQFVEITRQVNEAVRSTGALSGLCVVYCPHTTAAITINENADPDVMRDIGAALMRLVPQRGDYAHVEGNSDAHINSALVGPCQTVIIEGGGLLLGQWQGIFFCEFDGPRERAFFVKILSDAPERRDE